MSEPPAPVREVCDDLGRLEHAYDEWRGAAEAAAVAWRWAPAGSRVQMPWLFANERAGDPPARLSTDVPSLKADWIEAGFDPTGRLVIARSHDDAGEVSYETFVRGEGATYDSAVFEHGRPIALDRLRYERGRLIRVDSCATRGWSQESYRYEADRVVEIANVSLGPWGDEKSERWVLGYDDAGRLSEIRLVEGAGAPMQVWTRPTRKLRALERDVVDGLTRATESAVAGLGLEEPIYCVALAYFDRLPPSVAVGTQAERERWLGEHGDEGAEYLWNPAEFALYADRAPGLTLDSAPELVQDCLELSQRYREEGDEVELVRGVCNTVAKRLDRSVPASWPARTDDFVVFAVDLELADLHRNLEATIGKRRLRGLEKRGLIPEPFELN